MNKPDEARKRMKRIVAKMKRYVENYDKQPFYLDYSDDTFIHDMLYGIGISISTKYEYAPGYDKFRKFLSKYVGSNCA
jgi:hypothetical protein